MWIFLGILVIVLVWFVATYNNIISLKEAVFTDEKAIGIQLDERNKLFDSLIASVKKYMEHEKGVFAEIVKLRQQVNTGNVDKEAEQKLSEIVESGELAKGINFTMEAYPELKSSNNMLQLQEAIESIERKLANAKKAYNRSIEDYNAKAESIPAVFIVNMFPGKLKFNFERWELPAEKIRDAEERRVEF